MLLNFYEAKRVSSSLDFDSVFPADDYQPLLFS